MRTPSQHAQVAKLCKAYVKELGLKCKVSSKSYAGGNSVYVYAWDADDIAKTRISDYCSQFEYGHFDGMTDSYCYSNTNENIPQVKFLFVMFPQSDKQS